jgi:dihydroorotate dehydrogenase
MMGIRSGIWNFVKRLLFRFDAEGVHRFSVAMVRVAIRLGRWPLRLLSGAARLPHKPRAGAPASLAAPVAASSPAASGAVRVFGMDFASRLGLAAGFDMDAEILGGLPDLGFGFAEIGTVTPRPQPGNDRPRLFREPERQAIFNRMGFNGLGAAIVAERVARIRPSLPPGFRVGINIGKNKDTPNEDAAQDYLRAASAFEDLADYIVINVSSPNTPGLRALQSVASLEPVVEGVNRLISGWKSRPPLLLKLAPEVRGEDLRAVIEACEKWGIDGWVLTNTLAGTIDVTGGAAGTQALSGGWSGGPLTEKSRQSLVEARSFTKRPIISVGGILAPEEAALRLELGADLVQIYTGWVFGGPGFPAKVAKRIAGK